MKSVIVLLALICAVARAEETPIIILKSKVHKIGVPAKEIISEIRKRFDTQKYREIKVQPIYDDSGDPDHLLIYLLAKQHHHVTFARADVDEDYHFLSIDQPYRPTSADLEEQPGDESTPTTCPDPSVQFIAFAPNNESTEQEITKEVADAAAAHKLKTVVLALEHATRQNYLAYMSCPNVRGNFYDGDADPTVITTTDGLISYENFDTTLKQKFAKRMTNIWLACEAYNDPMLTSVAEHAESRKYAAGINDLMVGPSDRAAACAMEAALDGKPMTQSFHDCYLKFDVQKDQWGFGGPGSDHFWD